MADVPINTRLAATSLRGTSNNPHPAELSGASTDPNKRLMGIPWEVRNEIYKLLLVQNVTVTVEVFHYRYTVTWPHRLDGPESTTRILRVSQQTLVEGTDVLYGTNEFYSSDLWRFVQVFVECKADCRGGNGIGKINAAKIKRAVFGLPRSIRYHWSLYHDYCLDYICRQFPGLQRLILIDSSYGTSLEKLEEPLALGWEERRHVLALLKTAARITKYHPVLRKAIWSGHNGYTKPTANGLMWGEWFVRIVPEGPLPILKSEPMVRGLPFNDARPGFAGEVKNMVKKTPFHVDYQGMDSVLDSLKIRRTSEKDDVAWYKAWKGHFALRSDATTSEVNPTEVKPWTGLDDWDPATEVDPMNHAMALARMAEIVPKEALPEGSECWNGPENYKVVKHDDPMKESMIRARIVALGLDYKKRVHELSQDYDSDLPVDLGEIQPIT